MDLQIHTRLVQILYHVIEYLFFLCFYPIQISFQSLSEITEIPTTGTEPSASRGNQESWLSCALTPNTFSWLPRPTPNGIIIHSTTIPVLVRVEHARSSPMQGARHRRPSITPLRIPWRQMPANQMPIVFFSWYHQIHPHLPLRDFGQDEPHIRPPTLPATFHSRSASSTTRTLKFSSVFPPRWTFALPFGFFSALLGRSVSPAYPTTLLNSILVVCSILVNQMTDRLWVPHTVFSCNVLEVRHTFRTKWGYNLDVFPVRRLFGWR